MSEQVIVGRHIDFKGVSQFKANIKGNPSTERACWADYFQKKAIDGTNDYTVTLDGTNDAIAPTAAGRPGFTITTGTGDNEVSFIATGLAYDISSNPEIETKLNIADVSGTTAFFGFSSAVKDASPEAIIDADGGVINAGSGITDAVGFVCDADKGDSSLYFASIKSSGAEQSVDTGIDWADGDSHVLRVKVDASGNAYGFVDGVQKARISAAVADVPLCAAFDAGTRANDGSNQVHGRYLKSWMDVP